MSFYSRIEIPLGPLDQSEQLVQSRLLRKRRPCIRARGARCGVLRQRYDRFGQEPARPEMQWCGIWWVTGQDVSFPYTLRPESMVGVIRIC